MFVGTITGEVVARVPVVRERLTPLTAGLVAAVLASALTTALVLTMRHVHMGGTDTLSSEPAPLHPQTLNINMRAQGAGHHQREHPSLAKSHLCLHGILGNASSGIAACCPRSCSSCQNDRTCSERGPHCCPFRVARYGKECRTHNATNCFWLGAYAQLVAGRRMLRANTRKRGHAASTGWG